MSKDTGNTKGEKTLLNDGSSAATVWIVVLISTALAVVAMVGSVA